MPIRNQEKWRGGSYRSADEIAAGKAESEWDVKKSKRAATVFAGLLGVLTCTSALLLAVAPAPLTPDNGPTPLMATEQTPTLAGVMNTGTPVEKGRWRYIYVRHSKTALGDQRQLGSKLGDHFVVASGPGGSDGAIQMTTRWSNQASAMAPPGASGIHPKCISVVLVGDMDVTVPTPAQLTRATQLVRTLQQELGIPADRVLMIDERNSPAGVGRFFPTAAFRESLIP